MPHAAADHRLGTIRLSDSFDCLPRADGLRERGLGPRALAQVILEKAKDRALIQAVRLLVSADMTGARD
jgi:hypothetical protein